MKQREYSNWAVVSQSSEPRDERRALSRYWLMATRRQTEAARGCRVSHAFDVQAMYFFTDVVAFDESATRDLFLLGECSDGGWRNCGTRAEEAVDSPLGSRLCMPREESGGDMHG
jgi:hypothetical protein